MGGVRRGNAAKRNDLAERNPEPPIRRRSVYRLLSAGFSFVEYFFIQLFINSFIAFIFGIYLSEVSTSNVGSGILMYSYSLSSAGITGSP